MNKELATSARIAWETFMDGADEAALLSFIDAHKELGTLPISTYPHLHRIRDMVLCGRGFRLCRAVVGDEEKLFFAEIAEPNLAEGGVPYWMNGEKLRAWIEEGDKNPAKDQVDWGKY